MNTTPVSPLSIQNLVKDYGPLRAVDHVSLELQAGEIFGLLGPNGAGKTSLISCIVGMEVPTEGRILVSGVDVTQQPRLAKSSVGLVPQEIVNHGYFNVVEILKFIAGYYGVRDPSDKIDELIHELKLYEHRKKGVRELSGGMRRRLMIAKALVHSPSLLLLDEPTAGVDVELRENLWSFVKKLKAQGVTVLLTTHYLEEAEELCDRVAIIDRGVVKKRGPTRELVRELTQRNVTLTLKDGREIHFALKSGEVLGEVLRQNCDAVDQINDIAVREGTLEEAFRRVIGGSL